MTEAEHHLSDNWILDAGSYVGAGGGGAAAQGGGLMIRPHIGLKYDFNWSALGLNYSYVDFPNGEISSDAIALSLDIPFTSPTLNWEDDDLTAADYFGVDSSNVSRHRSHLAARVRAYYPSSDSKTTSGGSFDDSLGLVGVDYTYFLDENWFTTFETAGAVAGGVGGYAELLGGIGYRFPLTRDNRIALLPALTIGGAGGGAVELFAHGDGALTITSSGKILANGGDTSTSHAQSGGGGSGGAIRLEGGSISIAGTLEAKGGNGLTATPGGGGRIAIKTSGNLTLGTIKLDGHRPGTLHISGSTPTAALSFSSGTLTIDTTYGYWTHTGGTHGVGVIENRDDDGIEYKTCSFSFPSINLATGLTVNLQGENSLILKTTNQGDISIGTTLSVDGGSAETAYPGFYSSSIDYGMGRLEIGRAHV